MFERFADRRFVVWVAAVSLGISGRAEALERPWRPIPVFELTEETPRIATELGNERSSSEPGIALALLRDDRPLVVVYRGVESMERGTPIGPETRFYIASIAKTMTATATLMLWERKALSLEDSLGRWVENIPECARGVRLIHLLQHTSGIPDYFDAFGDTASGIDNARVLTFVRQLKALEFGPGTRYAYSNTGYVLLAEVIARASGRGYATFVEDSILTPLGMARTTLVGAGSADLEHRARAYRKKDGGFVPDRVRDHRTLGGGGIYSTLDDLVIWYRAVVESKLIKPSSTALLFETPVTFSGRRSYLGMGWSDETPGPKTPMLHGLRAYGSFGVLGGHSAAILFYPDHGLAWIALSNVAEGALPPPGLMERFFRRQERPASN